MVSTALPRYQRLVDGLVLPAPVSDEPALEFCNTRAGWGTAEPGEYLRSYEHLAVWAGAAGLIDAAACARLCRSAEREPEEARRVLERALALRSAVYASCTAPSAAAWDVVARAAHTAAGAAVLVRDAPPGRRWVIPETTGLELPLLEAARAAGALLASTDPGSIGRCAGRDCGWLFLDSHGRRRWCTMAVCGNRAKARRHAVRSRGESA